jgi:hypothetical protein
MIVKMAKRYAAHAVCGEGVTRRVTDTWLRNSLTGGDNGIIDRDRSLESGE